MPDFVDIELTAELLDMKTGGTVHVVITGSNEEQVVGAYKRLKELIIERGRK